MLFSEFKPKFVVRVRRLSDPSSLDAEAGEHHPGDIPSHTSCPTPALVQQVSRVLHQRPREAGAAQEVSTRLDYPTSAVSKYQHKYMNVSVLIMPIFSAYPWC